MVKNRVLSKKELPTNTQYKYPKKIRGRFAPTPSGNLHFGSLVCALASYLDVKSAGGIWVIRIDDLDTPRVKDGASEQIIETLDHYNLISDEPIYYQSDHLATYREFLNDLIAKNLTYECECTRKRIRAIGGIYDNKCRNRKIKNGRTCIRLKINDQNEVDSFSDGIYGLQQKKSYSDSRDFIISRKDGIPSYEYSVVIDDYIQEISHVLRGKDLIFSTFNQLILQKSLDINAPEYAHIPLVMNPQKRKLSKSDGALLDKKNFSFNLYLALNLLGQNPIEELKSAKVPEIIDSAIMNWKRDNVPNVFNKHVTEFLPKTH